MRILHLSTWKQRCGVADFTESIVTNLAAQAVESEVFPLDMAALRYTTTAEFLREMDRFTHKAAGFDLVHVQHEFTLFAGSGGLAESIGHFGHVLTGLQAAGRPTVVTFHSEPAFRPQPGAEGASLAGGLGSFLQWVVRKLRARRVDAHLQKLWRNAVAPHFGGRAGNFRGLVHCPRARLALINSGLAPQCVGVMPLGYVLRDPAFFQVDRAEAKSRLGLATDSVLLTVFGFVTAYKGHLLAVKALKKLPPQYHLAIVGGTNPANADGTLNAILETWEGEDPKRLMITGYASRETVDLYHAAGDICLAPFQPGNLTGSASATWALTSGKPTIASNIPAFAEIQEAADCLALVTPNAVHELAWQIQQLAGDPTLQQKLVRNALKFASERSWNRVVAGLIDVYGEVTAASRPRSALPASEPRQIPQAA